MRPDLPLLLAVAATGAALAIFAGDATEPGPPAARAPAAATEITPDFLANPSPAVSRCLGVRISARRGGDEEPQSPEGLIADVSRTVEAVRELRFSAPVDASFLDGAAFEERIAKEVRAETPPRVIEREGEILKLLGAIPPDTDFADLYEETLTSQVAGVYIPESEELLVRTGADLEDPADLPIPELIILAHELEHALADQRLGLREGLVEDPAAVDRGLAYASVIEADATLTMLRYSFEEFGIAGQLGSISDEEVTGAQEFEALPFYVQRNLAFPYLEGLRLICYRLLKEGWDGVNELYAKPPASTDEVLFPVRYGDGPPADPPAAGRPGSPWRRLGERELGAAELEWLFQAPGDDREAELPRTRRLIAGWTGGRIELWRNGETHALGISLVETPGADALCGAMAAWWRAWHPEAAAEPAPAGKSLALSDGEQAVALACPGSRVRMGIAPDLGNARELAGIG